MSRAELIDGEVVMAPAPIDVDVATTSRRLDFRSDPADEIIAATSIVHDLPLLTRDARIRGSKLLSLAL